MGARAVVYIHLYSGVKVCGIKGPTILALHPCFDRVGGVVIDDLHGTYLGVTLTFLCLWFDKTIQGKPYVIENQVI